VFRRNVSGKPRRLQQLEQECARRIHGWTCGRILAQIHALSLAATRTLYKSIARSSDWIPGWVTQSPPNPTQADVDSGAWALRVHSCISCRSVTRNDLPLACKTGADHERTIRCWRMCGARGISRQRECRGKDYSPSGGICSSRRFQVFWFLRKPFFRSSRMRSKSALVRRLFQAGFFWNQG